MSPQWDCPAGISFYKVATYQAARTTRVCVRGGGGWFNHKNVCIRQLTQKKHMEDGIPLRNYVRD